MSEFTYQDMYHYRKDRENTSKDERLDDTVEFYDDDSVCDATISNIHIGKTYIVNNV